MRIYQDNEIINLSLLGSAGSGKTTFAECMLFEGGVIQRRGEVNQKNTVSDSNEVEQEQSCSIYSTVLYSELAGKKFNVLDTSGADDFVNAVISSLTVTDFALMLLNAQNGVEVGTDILLRHTKKLEKSTVFVVNHLDHDKTNFEKTVEDLKARFGNKAAVIQYPVNQGPSFNSVIDILLMKMLKFYDDGKVEILDIPDSEKDKAEEYQSILIESAAENDEDLMEIFFEEETLNLEQMRSGIFKGIKNRDMFPIFCSAAKSNMGVKRIMEFLTNAPTSIFAPVKKTIENEEIKQDKNAPLSLFMFKTSVEHHLGEVSYFKVVSGTLTEGVDLINQTKQNKERLSQIYVVAGSNREKVSKLVAGDIGATVKLRETKTNHTLSLKNSNIEFPCIDFPNPKYRTAIKAINESDDEKLGEILNRMHDEDPTIILEYSKELKQLILHGQGEHHLNILRWHLINIHKIEVEFISPKIPYRETITKVAISSYRHKKQSGGAGQFGEVHLVIDPSKEGEEDPKVFKSTDGGKDLVVNVRDKDEKILPWGGKLKFYNCIVGGVIDTRFLPAILKGIMEKMEEGPLTGSYARDIKVCVFDGKMHPVDSNEISFKIAGAKAFSDAFKNAGPKIMEPIYNVDIFVPSDRMGDVMSDLQSRRAIIVGMQSESNGFEKITTKVPLAEMNRYSTVLSSITSGKATYNMEFDKYSQVPGDLQKDLLKAYEAEQNEE